MAAVLSKEQAEVVAEMLEDGQSLTDVKRYLNVAPSSVHSLIAHCVFLPADKRTPEQEIIRETILYVLLGEGVVKKALKAVSETDEKRSLKVTTIMGLTGAEKKLLEKQGHADFVEFCKTAEAILKVEETKDTIPPDRKILEKLIELVKTKVSVSDMATEIVDFSPPHPDTPEV